MKKPTVRQCQIISRDLKLNHAEWFVKKWREFKGGIEVHLVHRQTGESFISEVRKGREEKPMLKIDETRDITEKWQAHIRRQENG